jgi:antitoxin component YwqK of YwqJK toxin-antitoxin module
MNKFLLLNFAFIVLFACSTKPIEVVEDIFPDGTPKTIKYYKSDAKEVVVKEILYYENGQKKLEGAYKNGERIGKWSYWYANGNLWSQGEYLNGHENGLKTVYHENGQKYYEGNLKDGTRIGKWNFWEMDGTLIKEIDYDNN